MRHKSPVTAPSSPRVQANPRMFRLFTSRWDGAWRSSKWAASPARSAWQSGTKDCGSRKPWARKRCRIPPESCFGKESARRSCRCQFRWLRILRLSSYSPMGKSESLPSRAKAARGALAKAPTGISGLDEITFGGLPRGRPTLICGSAGCGKTLFGMEFLIRGVQLGEAAVCVTFEERAEDIIANFASLGFDLPTFIAEKKLII